MIHLKTVKRPVLACSLLTLTVNLHAVYNVSTIPISPEGQFTANNGTIHYWTASGGYSTYDTASGTTNPIGLPPGGTLSNGFGDAFGVYDSSNNLFYAASLYGFSDSDVYTYNGSGGSWQTPGPEGVTMINAYGGQVSSGQLYVSGLAEPWNGTTGQSNFVFAFDHLAIPGGDPARHDTLIETAGNSAHLAIAPNGDFYYGTFTTNTLYRWTASQVASVVNDLYADEEDTFLTLGDAAETWALPGGGNGLAVDAGGNVFFAVNDFSGTNDLHTLGWLDTETGTYETIVSSNNFTEFYGAISVDGDFSQGDPLYFTPSPGGDILEVTIVPEPAIYALLFSGFALLFACRRSGRLD
ncbi:MAG: PEP-CTERM sorting domain-containing protein [Verrucomicrobiota bacterium]